MSRIKQRIADEVARIDRKLAAVNDDSEAHRRERSDLQVARAALLSVCPDCDPGFPDPDDPDGG